MNFQYVQPVKVHCDNEGIIQKMNKNHSLMPQDTIQDDYDVYAELV